MQENFIKTISATYKILDAFPEHDPLKIKAKERVLLIMEKLTVGTEIFEDIAVLEQYLELAKSQGWIDAMNFLIIRKEWSFIEASLQKELSSINYQFSSKSEIKESVAPTKTSVSGNGLSNRQSKILDLLNKTEKMQVQDIARQMSSVTKRTIRRDLDDLLKKGKVVRTGEFSQVFYQNMGGTNVLS